MPTEKRSRKKAVREKCIDCCGGNRAEVRRCPSVNCPLWRYRMGAEAKQTIDTETGTTIRPVENI